MSLLLANNMCYCHALSWRLTVVILGIASHKELVFRATTSRPPMIANFGMVSTYTAWSDASTVLAEGGFKKIMCLQGFIQPDKDPWRFFWFYCKVDQEWGFQKSVQCNMCITEIKLTPKTFCVKTLNMLQAMGMLMSPKYIYMLYEHFKYWFAATLVMVLHAAKGLYRFCTSVLSFQDSFASSDTSKGLQGAIDQVSNRSCFYMNCTISLLWVLHWQGRLLSNIFHQHINQNSSR